MNGGKVRLVLDLEDDIFEFLCEFFGPRTRAIDKDARLDVFQRELGDTVRAAEQKRREAQP